MKGNPLKASIFVFFMLMAILSGAIKSLAQDNDNSDEQAREVQTQQTLDQIHDLESKMQDNAKRLDALEKAVNQPEDQTAVTEEDSNQTTQEEQAQPQAVAPVNETLVQALTPSETATAKAAVPTQQVPVQAVIPVQIASAAPVNVLAQPPIFYAPETFFPKEHTFEISQETYYSDFNETGGHKIYGNFNGIVDDHKSTGGFYGLYSAYNFRPMDSGNWPLNVYHADVHGDFGFVDYNYGEDDKLRNIDTYIVEPRVWVGKDFNFDAEDRVTPYIGFGYRFDYEQLKDKFVLFDEQNPALEIHPNNVQTQYLYIPVGTEFSLRPADGWRIDMDAEYDYLAWGRVTEYPLDLTYGPLSLRSVTINNTLNKGYGLRGSVKFIKEVNSFDYFFEPFIRYWNISASETNYSIQQDKNYTVEAGARLGLDF